MLDVFNTIAPSTANYQEFYYRSSATTNRSQCWNKPRGVSMVRFLLIGAGGGGSNGSGGGAGGGSGAVTSLIIPAMFVPDRIVVAVGNGGAGGAAGGSALAGSAGVATSLFGTFTSSTLVTLLAANAGSGGATGTGGAGGTATTTTPFSTMGIFQSIAGQAGSLAEVNVTASATTFLSGGAGGNSTGAGVPGTVTPNYGYPTVRVATAGSNSPGSDGYFMTQPIMVGCGGAGASGATSGGSGGKGGNGGIGCGGGAGGRNTSGQGAGGAGGNGAVFIWAW